MKFLSVAFGLGVAAALLAGDTIVGVAHAAPPAQPVATGPGLLLAHQPVVDHLDNGLTVVTVEFPTPGIVAYYTLIRAGSRDEVEKGRSGYAHLFEHLMFRGTKKISAEDYEKRLQAMGADNNAFTTDDFTLYIPTVPKDALPELVSVESDRFEHLDVAPPAYKDETGAVLGEYNKDFSDPYWVMDEALRQIAFTSHTYGHTTIGFRKDVEAMPNAYDYSKSFFQRFYTPDDATIFVVGDIDRDKTLALIRAGYKDWTGHRAKPEIKAEPEQTAPRTKALTWKNPTVPRLTIGYKIPSTGSSLRDVAAFTVLRALLFDESSALPVEGTESGLDSTTLDDVKIHRKKVFCRERMVVGIAGGFPDGFDKRFAADLAKRLPACDSARAELPPFHSEKGVHVLIVDKPAADATAISIGFRTQLTRASVDFPAVAFFTDYLGLHRQSAGQLYHQLRELRGLNYGDYAYAELFQQEPGVSRYPLPNIVRREQMTSIWIRPVKPKNGIFALRAALAVYSRLLATGISKSEIERFREFLTRYVGLEQQTENRRLGYAMDDVAYGLKKPYLETMRGGWAALDEASLKAATDRWLTAKDISIAIVAKDGEALAAALEKGDPSPPSYDTPKPASVTTDDTVFEKYPLGIDAKNVRVVPVGAMFK